MQRTLVWKGIGEFRAEIACAEVDGDRLLGRGTQIGVEPAPYELRYELVSGSVLRVELVGVEAQEIPLGEADFFDLGYSPLFNSLPVRRYGLHRGGDARDFVMTWVSVPDLTVLPTEQRYEPIRPGLVRYRGTHGGTEYTYEVEFDDDGFVTRYPELAERVA